MWKYMVPFYISFIFYYFLLISFNQISSSNFSSIPAMFARTTIFALATLSILVTLLSFTNAAPIQGEIRKRTFSGIGENLSLVSILSDQQTTGTNDATQDCNHSQGSCHQANGEHGNEDNTHLIDNANIAKDLVIIF